MDLDFKGFAKDNKELLLSILGIVVLILMMGSAASGEEGVFGFWDFFGDGFEGIADDTPGSNGGEVDRDTLPAPISNGKDDLYVAPPHTVIESGVDYRADIVTSNGTIEVDLYEQDAPDTVNNFVFLARNDFYKGTTFHRVIENFIIQGGDPRGDGTGGPGYQLGLENTDETLSPFELAMSESPGVNSSHGSQFFITSRDFSSSRLEGEFSVFGQIIDGFAVVDEIETRDVYNENNEYRPYEPILINDIRIIEM
jgi:peptidylprolyl isomerase